MYLEHRLSALLQLHLHSQLNTWLQWIKQRQLQDETRNIYVWGLGASYIRELTVVFFCVCGFFLSNKELSSFETSNCVEWNAVCWLLQDTDDDGSDDDNSDEDIDDTMVSTARGELQLNNIFETQVQQYFSISTWHR